MPTEESTIQKAGEGLQQALVEAQQGQWLTKSQVKNISKKLGNESFEIFAYQALVKSEKPSKLLAAAEALTSMRYPILSPDKIEGDGYVLTSDVFMICGKAQRFLQRLRELLCQYVDQNRTWISNIAKQNKTDDENEVMGKLQYGAKQFISKPKLIDWFTDEKLESLLYCFGHEYLARTLEHAAQGHLFPFWWMIAESDSQSFNRERCQKEVAERFKFESMRDSKMDLMHGVFSFADEINLLRLKSLDKKNTEPKVWATRMCSIMGSSMKIDGYIGAKKGKKTYQTVLSSVEGKFVNSEWEIKHQEIVDLICLASQVKKEFRVVVNDWEFLRQLLDIPIDNKSEYTAKVPLSYFGLKNNRELTFLYFPSTSNKKDSSMLLRLAAEANTRRWYRFFQKQNLTFGSRLKVTDRRFKKESIWEGHLWGFDPVGNLRIVNPNGVIGVYPAGITAEDGKPNVSVEYVGPPKDGTDILRITTAKSQTWKSKEIKLNESEFSEPVKRNVVALVEREVARKKFSKGAEQGRNLYTISRYTDLIKELGFESFIVGGAIRDTLLGGNPNDVDLSTTIPVLDLMMELMEKKLGQDKKNKSAGDPLPDLRKKLAFSILQVEPDYADGIDIVCFHDIDDYGASFNLSFDAMVRDFTINAVYSNPDKETLIDPIGLGIEDLRARKLRFVEATRSDPAENKEALKRFLLDDPVNIARWIKFHLKKYKSEDQGTWSFKDAETWYIDIIRSCLQKLRKDKLMDLATQYRFLQRMGGTPETVFQFADKNKLVDELIWILRMNSHGSLRS